ncbi:hypothetical protein D3C72_1916270 [compost metagenome]
MQDAVGLAGARIDRHGRADPVLARAGEGDAEVFDQGVAAECVECLDRHGFAEYLGHAASPCGDGNQRMGTRPAPKAVSMRTSSHLGPTFTSGKSPTDT